MKNLKKINLEEFAWLRLLSNAEWRFSIAQQPKLQICF